MLKSKAGLAAAAAALMASCLPSAAMAGDTKDVVRSGVIGAAGGAVVGAVVPGISTGNGALIGGLGGAAVGAIKKKHHYYRDSQGRRYWIDKHGRRHYG